MSAWTDRILQEFPADLSRFWIACDPDDLLLDERILHGLRERGFEVLPFEDSVSFRTEYEERYRGAWDRGEEGSEKSLVLQFHGTDANALPWDYVRSGRLVRLGLADLFPKLSYSVIRQVGPEHHEPLFAACVHHAQEQLGDSATMDFILTHIFGVSPYLIERPEDFWRELLRLHYRMDGLPPIFAGHVAKVLGGRDLFKGLPIADLFHTKGAVLKAVQSAWERFVGVHLPTTTGFAEHGQGGYLALPPIPLAHPDIRVIVDSMFLDGTLHPLMIQERPTGLPRWAEVGIVQDPAAMEKLVADGAARLGGDLPAVDSAHREWAQLARRLGEVIHRYHQLPTNCAESVHEKVRQIRSAADDRLRGWVMKHYANLPSLAAARGPVMVHHIPRFLSIRRDAGEKRVALLVFDGLAMDQWIQIREYLDHQAPQFGFEEGACFAWLPTLTSVSRQALFSGMKPREFSESIETTAQESALWARFWRDNGLRKNEVIYRRGVKRIEELAELEAVVTDPVVKAAGIVIDTVDGFVHGAMFGKRGLATQIASWCYSGFFERLFTIFLNNGFEIYLTADHGNVEAVGIGRLSEGLVSEVRGERVRVYRSEDLAASARLISGSFSIDTAGLPANYLPLYAGARGAFVRAGDQLVAHGGLSVEELIVPFVKVSHAGNGPECAPSRDRV